MDTISRRTRFRSFSSVNMPWNNSAPATIFSRFVLINKQVLISLLNPHLNNLNPPIAALIITLTKETAHFLEVFEEFLKIKKVILILFIWL